MCAKTNQLRSEPEDEPLRSADTPRRGRGLQSELLTLTDLTPRDISAWDELASAAISPNPFMEPDYVLPSAHAWGVDDVGVLVVRHGRDWVGAVPVRQARSWKGVPGRCLTIWRHAYCYLGTPLVAGDDPAAVLAALLSRALTASGCMALEMVDADGPLNPALAEALETQARPILLSRLERAVLERVNGNFDLQLSASHRKSYGRRRRQLEGAVGPLTTRDDSHNPDASSRFLEIESTGWKGDHGTAMACIPGHGEWFSEVCHRFAAKERLLMLSLANDQHTVAMRCNLIVGDVLFGLEGCFDEAFGRYSPGIQLELAAVEHLNSTGYRFEDSCTAPDNSTLNRLWPGRRQLQTVMAIDRGASAAATYAKWTAAAHALPLVRKLKRPEKGLRGH